MTSTVYRDTPREQPQAIETVYKGYRFRSRLEARWAVFFDNASFAATWQYEHEGYVLPSGWYLPDFEFDAKFGSDKFFVEVKPQSAKSISWTRELKLAEELSQKFGEASVAVVYGDPLTVVEAAVGQTLKVLHTTLSTAHIAFGLDIIGRLAVNEKSKATLLKAAIIARQARFEHGECP